jgi:hypothetical protein
VAPDGSVYDCDFNQVLQLELLDPDGSALHIKDVETAGPALIAPRQIRTGDHCYACTTSANPVNL